MQLCANGGRADGHAHQLPSRLGRKALLYCWQFNEKLMFAREPRFGTALRTPRSANQNDTSPTQR